MMQLSLKPLYGGGFTVAITQVTLVYYTAAFLLHFVVPWLFPMRSIQAGKRRPSQVAKEALNSIGPLLVKAAVLTIVERLHAAGHGLMYSGWPQSWQQWAYILGSIVALDYFHDAWFYWMHRLLHWKPLYRHVHYLHHRSTVPTAFSGYSFHVVEAMLVFCNEIVEILFFPLHIGLHRMYHLYTTLIHIGGHVGYEIAPLIPTLEAILWAALARGAPAKGLNTVAHHDMHHRFPNRHFSLYFTHWDRWCGTQHPDYVHRTFADLPRPACGGSDSHGGDDNAARGVSMQPPCGGEGTASGVQPSHSGGHSRMETSPGGSTHARQRQRSCGSGTGGSRPQPSTTSSADNGRKQPNRGTSSTSSQQRKLGQQQAAFLPDGRILLGSPRGDGSGSSAKQPGSSNDGSSSVQMQQSGEGYEAFLRRSLYGAFADSMSPQL